MQINAITIFTQATIARYNWPINTERVTPQQWTMRGITTTVVSTVYLYVVSNYPSKEGGGKNNLANNLSPGNHILLLNQGPPNAQTCSNTRSWGISSPPHQSHALTTYSLVNIWDHWFNNTEQYLLPLRELVLELNKDKVLSEIQPFIYRPT